MSLDPLYELVAKGMVFFHGLLAPVFGEDSFFSWALAVVLLTMTVRLLLFPLFVKQVKSQRAMQVMQPKIKEIRDKYRHDRQRMNEEMLALQKEHGNPLLGCLPIFAQIPLFIALFHVLNALRPRGEASGGFCSDTIREGYVLVATSGLSCDQVESIATSKLFGVSLVAAFNSPARLLDYLGAAPAAVRIMAGILVVLMAGSTYLTQRQMMARNVPTDPQQQLTQKIILYVIPAMLFISGALFPIGVLIYWLTTNLWSMGQQFFVLKRMPLPATTGTGGKSGGAPSRGSSATGRGPDVSGGRTDNSRVPRSGSPRPVPPTEGTSRPPTPSVTASSARRPAGGAGAKRRGKGQRPGGRH